MSVEPISPTETLAVDAEHPWLGLLPYREEHSDFFFGRDREIEDILGRIRDNSLTTLYSQSGWGKSSLLAAGVIPRLRDTTYEPVVVRLNYTEGNTDTSTLIDQTHAALAISNIPEGPTLWERLHHRETSISRIPVLLFDQFEEIFTLGSHPKKEGEVDDWLEQMTDLLQNRPPRELAERFAKEPQLAEQYHFNDALIRIVFTLREDYLADLEKWKARLPLLMQNRMALSLLTGPQARQAVLGPAQLGEDRLVSREVAESIVRRVVGDDIPADSPLSRIKAVPPLLSLLCEQLNTARLSERSQQITLKTVSEQSTDILQRFYEDSFLSFPEEQRSVVRNFLENSLLTKTDPVYRNTMVSKEAHIQLLEAGVSDPTLVFNTLLQRRLITAETRNDVQRFEITHDVLVPFLVRSRKEQQDRDSKEKAERALIEEQTKARKRRLKAIQFFVIGMVMIFLSTALFILARSSEKKQAKLNHDFGILKDQLIAKITKEDIPAIPDPTQSAVENPATNPEGASIIEEAETEKNSTVGNETPIIKTLPPILDSLGMDTISDRANLQKSIEVLSERNEFEDLFLLALLKLVEGAHLADEKQTSRAIELLNDAIVDCNRARTVADDDDDRRQVELQATRFKSRLSDIHYGLNTPESLQTASELLRQCIAEATAFDKEWNKNNQNRFHYYKTRLSKILAAQSKRDEARKFLVEGIEHIRSDFANDEDPEGKKGSLSLADILFSSAEIARVQLEDNQLAVDLHTEILGLRKDPPESQELSDSMRLAVITQYWYLTAAWLGLDKSSPEFTRVASEGEAAARWIVKNSDNETFRAEQQTSIGVFQMFRLKALLETDGLSSNDQLLKETIGSFDLALSTRIKNPSISKDGLPWLYQQLDGVVSFINANWDKMNLSSASKQSLDEMLENWGALYIQEMEGDPTNTAMAQWAAVASDWRSVIDQRRMDGASVVHHALKAQKLFLSHSERFKDEQTGGKAWGLAGASSATGRIAEALGGDPSGYELPVFDGKSRLTFHELSVRQAESAIKEALLRNSMDEVKWMKGKLDDATHSQVKALRSLSYSDADIAASELRKSESYFLISKKYGEIFAENPNGENAYSWGFSGANLLSIMRANSGADLDFGENFLRDMLGKLEVEFPKNSEDAKFLLALGECQTNLATTILHRNSEKMVEGNRPERIVEAMNLMDESREHTELALKIASSKSLASESWTKEKLIWILQRLIVLSQDHALLNDRLPLWQSREAELLR